MKIVFVRFGFYADIPIPFTKRIIVLDIGWRPFGPRNWFSIWWLGWKKRKTTKSY